MINSQLTKDIKSVLNYLWYNEKRHYEESNRTRKHIFVTLKRLAKEVKYQEGN